MSDIPEDVREKMNAAVLAAWNDAPRCPGEMYPSEAALIVDAALAALRAAGYEVRRAPVPAVTNAEQCRRCSGRGFDLDWIDPGGIMRAVPGDTCRHCSESGNAAAPPAPSE